jgi:hypothetical protein
MGKIIAGILGALFLFGALLLYVTLNQKDDSRAIKEYVESRGAAPAPSSWRGKIGKGI